MEKKFDSGVHYYPNLKRLLGLKIVIMIFATSFSGVYAAPGSPEDGNKKIAVVAEVQQRQISGKVTDKAGVPLAGVSILVKGTTIGVVTDIEGDYRLTIPPNAATLVFSFIGMNPQEVAISNRSEINVTLEEVLTGLDEVVVVGYGTQRRSEVTGAIASIKAESLEKMPVQNIGKAMTGLAPGLRVFDSDGDPSMDPVIQIRGESTVSLKGASGDTQPLIVIDGSPGGSLRDVSPEDIASIEILKDAAAAAIYGSRGANGVVLIQTKRGFEGKVTINVESNVRYNAQVSKHNLARPYDHAVIVGEGQINDNAGITPRQYHTLDWLKDVEIDYMDGLFTDSWSSTQRISIAGGSKDHKFRLSGTYDRDDGTTVNNYFNQGTFLFASDHNITDKLTWSNTIIYKTSKRSKGYDYEPRRRMLDSELPYIIAVDRNDPQYYYDVLESGQSWAEYAAAKEALQFVNGYSFNINPTYKIIKGLELSDRFVFRQTNVNNETFLYATNVFGVSQPRNDVTLNYSSGWNYINDVILNFNRKFVDRHLVYATAVWSVERSFSRDVSAYRSGLPLTIVPAISLGDIATMTNDGGYGEDARLGAVGRIGYTFDDKYVLAASVRLDASSRFTKKYRWGTFPSVSFAWNLHKESFMQNIPWISNARIRGSWGQLGRDKLSRYQAFSAVNLETGYDFNGSLVSGAAINSLAYEGTGWETVTTMDLGAEAYFLHSRLKVAYNYWRKTTTDMIFDEELPYIAGLRDLSIAVNAGELFNRGNEIDLEWKDTRGNISYRIGTNISTYYSEIVSWPFAPGVDYIRNVGRSVFGIAEGRPLMSFFVYETDGLWQNDAEIDAVKYHQKDANGNFMYSNGLPVWGWPAISRGRPKVGSVKFVDRNNDGNVDLDDRYWAGQRYPKLVIGFNGGLQYKGLDFYFQANANTGNSIMIEMNNKNGNVFGQKRYCVDLTAYEAWIGEGSTNKANRPVITNGGANNLTQDADNALYSGNYLRIKAINVGYTLRPSILKKLGVNSVRLYVTGYNLFTFTNYPGFDPEMNVSLGNDASYSYAGFERPYPYFSPISYIGGIQVGF